MVSPSRSLVALVTRMPPATVPFLLAGSSTSASKPRTTGHHPVLNGPLCWAFVPACGLSGKRIPDAVGRADVGLLGVRLTEVASQLFHKSHERRVGDERAGPQAFVQLRLRDDARRLVDEQREQVEGLARQVDVFVALTHLASRAIEREGAEAQVHVRSPETLLNLS
jgi:hypothetical protein